MKLVVIDLEGSGLNTEPRSERSPKEPDCILEVGLVVLNAETLVEEYRDSWLVQPPFVSNAAFPELEVAFDTWETNLREKNKFVFDMHSKPGTDSPAGESLLQALRKSLKSDRNSHEDVEARMIAALYMASGLKDEKTRAEFALLHPGNSPLMLCGNSIANYDIPMLRLWMPNLLKCLSYRIMDVSVLRSFYQDIAKVKLPEGLAEKIKSGGGGHRALSDALFCAEALRELVTFGQTGGITQERVG